MYQVCPPTQNLLWILAVSITYLASVSAPASAQTAPMTTSGLNTQISGPVSVDGKVQYNITGGTRPGGGANLFHSFGDFGVPANNIANFHNNSGLPTSNILGRVTGGNISNIFGTIQTTDFGSANLFLMNPAGFLFGPGATTNVGGMVTFTSADYLRLSNEDGTNTGIFYANPASPSLLSASPVAAFGFLGSNPGAITVQGSQFVATGIALIGGNITIDSGTRTDGTVQRATLSAPTGQIHLASTASTGEFAVFDGTLQESENVNGASFTSFGSVSLAPGSTVNISGTDTVSIRGGQFVLSVNNATLSTAESPSKPGNILLDAGSTVTSLTFGTDPGGAVTLSAEKGIVLRGNSSITSRTDGQGNAGHVHVQAPSIEMREGSNIVTSTKGLGHAENVEINGNQITISSESSINTRTSAQGHGGDITIRGLTGKGTWAKEVRLSDASKLVSETSQGRTDTQGPAGNIHIETARLDLSGTSFLSSKSRGSTGDAGTIFVNARDSVTISSSSQLTSDSSEQSLGNAGHITILAPSIIVENGGGVVTSTSSTGNAGTITINANNLHLLSGGHINSGSLIEYQEFLPSGSAGSVTVQGLATRAQAILIDGAGSGIFTDTQGTGSGGSISIQANSVTLKNGGQLSSQTSGTEASAGGGSITVHGNQVQLNSGASITATSTGAANAGNINITAINGLRMQQTSSITTQAASNNTGSHASGGNIKVTTSPTATVYLQDSTISASVPDGQGGGGNISIDPQLVILKNSKILAQADQGTGGNITITARLFLPDTISIVNADSGSGVNGTVTIQSPNSPASGRILPLGNRLLQATSLFTQRCAAVTNGTFSSFRMAANSLPVAPGNWLTSPVMPVISAATDSTTSKTGLRYDRNLLIEEQPLLSLRQIAPAGFLIQSFGTSQPTSCSS